MSKTQNRKLKLRVWKKEKVKYECKICDFITSNKTDFVRHKKTVKHMRNKCRVSNAHQNTLDNSKNDVFSKKLICLCDRAFKTRSGLWKHKKKCEYHKFKTEETAKKEEFQKVSKEKKDFHPPWLHSDLSLDDQLKLIQIEKITIETKSAKIQMSNERLINKKLKKEIAILDKPIFSKSPNPPPPNPPAPNTLTNEAVKTIGEIAGDNNCNNTNNISINMYLNENCKNALNLEDFVKQITVSLQDLDYSKENGYAKGVTNILVKQLNDLSPTERPIHCSDKKRMKFYVKDDNKWAKDENNVKLTNSIKCVGVEQVKTLSEWEKLHPTFQEDPALLTEWQTTLSKLTPGQDTKESQKNYTKIKKELCKVVDIKPELTK